MDSPSNDSAVSYITKLLNWKQITTLDMLISSLMSCFLYHKVTKLKANHNIAHIALKHESAVSYITKLLNWKQITTYYKLGICFAELFPISQSY